MDEIKNIQPLEKILKAVSKETSKFPRMLVDYYVQYCAFLNSLRANIYPTIDAGLAANSEKPGYYTAHNSEHFDEVVRYAGDLIGADAHNWNDILAPYEIYVLLIAIRIHDVGNVHGRELHEKKCFPFLINHEVLLGSDRAELKAIAKIAEAHGGKTAANDKDTIGILNTEDIIGNIKIRPRLLAGIVRFADEICESRARANNYLIRHGSIPKHNEIYHHYAAAIVGASYEITSRRFTIKFQIEQKDVSTPWGCEDRKNQDGSTINAVFLIDEILDRLEKMDRERRYCNNFIRSMCTVDSIRASIEIVDAYHDTIEQISIPELDDTGYPDGSGPKLKEKLSNYCGAEYGERLNSNNRS